MQSNPLTTTITHANGETNTCVLKEKINNENGELVYSFITRIQAMSTYWPNTAVNGGNCRGPYLADSIFKTLCDVSDRSQ